MKAGEEPHIQRTSRASDVGFGVLITISCILGLIGVGVIVWQAIFWLHYGYWHPLPFTAVLGQFRFESLANPNAEFMGLERILDRLYKELDAFPLSGAFLLLSFCILFGGIFFMDAQEKEKWEREHTKREKEERERAEMERDEREHLQKVEHEQAERRREYRRTHPELTVKIHNAIANEQALEGMTKEQLIVSLGEPDRITQEGDWDRLTYNDREPKCYFLKNGLLVRME
jgi:hypothetical protein